ncbi:MAG: PQQ-binding-like beta-propeller repeat protein [Planctomycetota bacterium]
MRLASLIIASLCAPAPAPALPVQEAPARAASVTGGALADGAVVEDWPAFLGPRRNGVSLERPLASRFSAAGPKLVWAVERGEGLASPAVGEGRLVFTHREEGQVHVDCLDPETGARRWRSSFPCDYSGRYFDNGGPRATPAIAAGHVVVHGAGGTLVCLALETGEVVWKRDTAVEYKVGDDYFGVVSSPLVVGDCVIQNVGAPGGPSVVGLALATGKQRWGAGKEWGPSCASPVPATIAGKARVLVIAGGESRPPTGGLMVLTPSGELTAEYPFRSRTTLSVNGPSPVPVGDSVFLTAAYNVGSALVDVDAEGRVQERWRDSRGLALEFATPIYVDGVLFAVDGVSGRTGAIVALDPATGKELARKDLEFEQAIGAGADARTVLASVGKGSVTFADGALWVLGDTGQLLTLRFVEGKFEVLARAPLFYARETWTPLVISHGRLYVCQNNAEPLGGAPARLLCYDIRGGQ